MLNRYPLWKYLMVALVVIIGTLYSAPNLYGEDPALQVSAIRGHDVKADTMDLVKKSLDDAKISIKSAVLENSQILFASITLMISCMLKSWLHKHWATNL